LSVFYSVAPNDNVLLVLWWFEDALELPGVLGVPVLVDLLLVKSRMTKLTPFTLLLALTLIHNLFEFVVELDIDHFNFLSIVFFFRCCQSCGYALD